MPPPQPAQARNTARLAFVTAPVLFACAAFAAGIALSRVAYRSPAWLLLASACAFLVLLGCRGCSAKRLRIAALLLAWCAAGLFAAETAPVTVVDPGLRVADYDGQPRDLTVRITQSEPERDAQGWHDTTMHLQQLEGKLERAGALQPDAGILLTLESRGGDVLPAVQCGDTLHATAKLRLPQTFHTPGAWSASDTLLLRGVTVTATLKPDEIASIARGKPGWPCRIHEWRAHLLERLTQAAAGTQSDRHPGASLSPDDTGVLAAALLGDRRLLSPDTRTAFQRTGTYHLLIVSGLSIAVLGGMLFALLRRARLPGFAATLVTLAALSGYALLTGFDMPVRRALLMTAVFMVGRLLYRRLEPLNSLAAAVLLLLAFRPLSLFEGGLQMTMLAVFSIAGIVSPLLASSVRPASSVARSTFRQPNDPGLPPRLAQLRVMLYLWAEALRPLTGRWISQRLPVLLLSGMFFVAEAAAVSLTLECCLAPLIAVYFHRFTALSVAGNILTLGWLFVLLPLGLVVLLLAFAAPRWALWPARLLAFVLHLAENTIAWLSHMRLADLRVPPARGAALLCICGCFLLAVWLARGQSRLQRLCAVFAILTIGALSFWAVPLRFAPRALEVTALDVGQGDSLLVLAPQAHGPPLALLVDSGGPAGPSGSAQAGERIGEDDVSNYLWSRGIRRLDAVALTHAHTDHMGGMPAVLRNFHPHELWVAANPGVKAYEALLSEAAALDVRVRTMRAPDAFAFGDVGVRAMSPAPGYAPGKEPSNEDSLVLQLRYAGRVALLEGDAQKLSEAAMVNSGIGHTDLLKVGHHGSLSSTTPRFLAAVSPGTAVISAGHNNLYGHPREPILDRLEKAHAVTWRTDVAGTTTFILDAAGVSAAPFDSSAPAESLR